MGPLRVRMIAENAAVALLVWSGSGSQGMEAVLLLMMTERGGGQRLAFQKWLE